MLNAKRCGLETNGGRSIDKRVPSSLSMAVGSHWTGINKLSLFSRMFAKAVFLLRDRECFFRENS